MCNPDQAVELDRHGHRGVGGGRPAACRRALAAGLRSLAPPHGAPTPATWTEMPRVMMLDAVELGRWWMRCMAIGMVLPVWLMVVAWRGWREAKCGEKCGEAG